MALLSLPSTTLALLFSERYVDPHWLLVCRFVCRQLRRFIKKPLHDVSVTFYSFVIRSLAHPLSLLRWADAQRVPLSYALGEPVVEHGDPQVLEWARSRGVELDYRAWQAAAMAGKIECLAWLHANKYSISASELITVADYAAYRGQVSALQWLASALKVKFTKNVCASAAYGGHLEVLKFLRSSGARWDRHVAINAANGGHVHILEYAHEQGLRFSDDDISATRHNSVCEWWKCAKTASKERAWDQAPQTKAPKRARK